MFLDLLLLPTPAKCKSTFVEIRNFLDEGGRYYFVRPRNFQPLAPYNPEQKYSTYLPEPEDIPHLWRVYLCTDVFLPKPIDIYAKVNAYGNTPEEAWLQAHFSVPPS